MISARNLTFSYQKSHMAEKSTHIVQAIKKDTSVIPRDTSATKEGTSAIDRTIDNVVLEFEQGHFYSILGPNGCGKTTLMDLLIGHLQPASGQVTLQNREISQWPKIEIAKQIALVAQNYNVNFPFTVKEVIMMGRHPYIKRFSRPSGEDMKRADEVMKLTGIHQFASRKITDLSGGERQRCLFARALCQDTPFLFLDEAFSNMDIHHTIRLLDIVKREVRKKGRTVVAVFHDINFAAIWSDTLVFMKQGRVIACGKTDDVMDEKLIENVFHVKPKIAYHPYSRAKQAYFRSEEAIDAL